LVQNLGGSMESAYLSFGEYEVVLILNLPDNMSAAAASMAISAGGALKAVKTAPLLTVDEAVEAMGKGGAAAANYRPPSASDRFVLLAAPHSCRRGTLRAESANLSGGRLAATSMTDRGKRLSRVVALGRASLLDNDKARPKARTAHLQRWGGIVP
jgi:hypothetical protein